MASRTTRHSSGSRKRTPAPASRTAGGNRSASKRRTTAGRSRNTRTQNGFRWGAEVILFVVIAFAVILFLSNFGLAGKLGTKLNTVSFGTFGVVSYILPFWLFLFCAFLLSNLRQKGIEHTRMVMKSVAACAFLWSLCTFCHLASFGKETAAFSTFFLRCHEGHKGGGVFGALIGRGMASGLGLLVAFIIAILVLILSIVLMMERSFFADLEYGITLRTNCADANRGEVLKEADELAGLMDDIVTTADKRTCGTVLYKGDSEWMRHCLKADAACLERIITDDTEILVTIEYSET